MTSAINREKWPRVIVHADMDAFYAAIEQLDDPALRNRPLLIGPPSARGVVLTDQEVLAGIGNAYSDEILHVAKMSPFALTGKITDEQMNALYTAMREVETDAVARSVGQKAAELKGEKRAGMRVHARTGLPCPVCGDTVREVSFADKSLQYCPTCQTGGKPLADRRLSRLLK